MGMPSLVHTCRMVVGCVAVVTILSPHMVCYYTIKGAEGFASWLEDRMTRVRWMRSAVDLSYRIERWARRGGDDS